MENSENFSQNMMNEYYSLCICKTKYCLDVHEASKYFGIGETELRKWIRDHRDIPGIVLTVGNKYFINRKKFEAYLDECSTIV